MTKYVYDFTGAIKDQKALLGGKGANLAEMTWLGLPVPPGFTITTEACRSTCRRAARRVSCGCRSRWRCGSWRTAWAAGSGIATIRCW